MTRRKTTIPFNDPAPAAASDAGRPARTATGAELMGRLETVAEYLRKTVLAKHGSRPARSHCGIPSQRSGIELMIAMGIAQPASVGDAWDNPGAEARPPQGWTERSVAGTIVWLACDMRQLRLCDAQNAQANINPSAGLSAAVAEDDTLDVLTELGLVQNGFWSERASEVFHMSGHLGHLLDARN